jgi:hypothetical protein
MDESQPQEKRYTITPEKKAEYNKKYYEKHLKGKPVPETVLESQREYRKRNPEKYRELNRLAQQRWKARQREQRRMEIESQPQSPA